MFRRKTKGQSVLEYAILFAVVVAALMVMQILVKRGFMGGLKESADKMGEQYSAANTAIEQKRSLRDNQVVKTEVMTTSKIGDFIPSGFTATVTGTVDKDTYSLEDRSGKSTTETKQVTDSAKEEKTRWSEYQSETHDNFEAPF